MTIAATYAKIVDLAEATTGIVSAPDVLPASLDDTQLPCVLTRVGTATWNEHAVGLYRQVRTYYLDCYVQPIGDGIGPDQGYKACLAPLYALGRTFVQNPTLDDTVDQMGTDGRALFSDSGVRAEMAYQGKLYHGFTITLVITEKAT